MIISRKFITSSSAIFSWIKFIKWGWKDKVNLIRSLYLKFPSTASRSNIEPRGISRPNLAPGFNCDPVTMTRIWWILRQIYSNWVEHAQQRFLKYSHQTLQKQHSYHINWLLLAPKSPIHHQKLDAIHLCKRGICCMSC